MGELTYDLIVFDWDGTLMDSRLEIVGCFQSAARDLELAVPSADDVTEIIGIGMREAIAKLFPELIREQHIQELIDQYRHHYFHPNKVPAELFQGIAHMLESLESDGYMLAVATSKGRRGLNMALERSGLVKRFHTTRCIDEAQSKPHPQMLQDILEFTGVDAARALMVGDTEYDLLMAKNAQVQGLGVCCGAHDRERLLACEPVACLNHTNELHDWLNEK